MTDLVDTTEMYLRTILDLEEEGIVPVRARIVERLGHSGPTVSQTVARMERDELLVVEDDRTLSLTAHGRDTALSVARKHRLAERLLVDIIGLDWSLVHDEACRWEHVMSEEVEKKLFTLLGEPTESPYGNPIPALERIGGKKAKPFLDGVIKLTDFATSEWTNGVMRRIGEPAQFEPDTLAKLHRLGIVPGERVKAKIDPKGGFTIASMEKDRPVTLPEETAAHLYLAT
jgi:DtxR family Mn-dependent transcriptional regulator